jgi:DNA-binding MarR family transcriptional regulator
VTCIGMVNLCIGMLSKMELLASLGIWIKDIKMRSGLHTQVVADCIKNLERNNLIKAVKSVKASVGKV